MMKIKTNVSTTSVVDNGETKIEIPEDTPKEMPAIQQMLVDSISQVVTWRPNISEEQNFYVGVSPIEGVGKALYAKRFIPKGSYILTFCGPLVCDAEATRRDMANFGRIMGNELQIGPDFYVYLQEPGRLINHSCESNAGIKDDTILVATKDIQKDEEITFDYSSTMDEGEIWAMECKCGQPNCRGYAADFRTLPRETRQKYLQCGLVQNFIKVQYDAETGEPLPKSS